MPNKGMSVFTANGVDYNINDPNIADEFSTSQAYTVGEFVFYQGNLYMFVSDHSAGSWNANHVESVLLGNALSRAGVVNDPSEQLRVGAYEQGGINSSGEDYTSYYRIRTGYVDIHDFGYVRTISDSGVYTYVYFYDKNKNFLWWGRHNVRGIDRILANSFYVRISFSYVDSTQALAPSDNITKIVNVYTRENYYGEVIGSNMLGAIANVNDAEIPVTFESGRLEATAGTEVSSAQFVRTKYIDIENYEWVSMNIASGVYCLIYYYTSTLGFIDYHGRYQTTAIDYDVPANAKYMRITLNYKDSDGTIDPYNIPFTYHFYGRPHIVNYLENLTGQQAEDISTAAAEYTTALISAGQKTEQFLFFTDPHIYGATDVKKEAMFETIKKTFYSLPETFILCGGDWLTWSDTQAQAAEKLGYISGKMWSLAYGKYYPMLGNHDTNYQGVVSADDSSNGELSNAAMTNLMFPEWNKCYYTFEGVNTHFYVLDTGLDTYGYMTEYRWNQIDWLADKLLEEDKTHSAIAMHIWYGSGENMERFSNAVKSIVTAYNSRQSVTIASQSGDYSFEQTYDFTSMTGRIEFIIAGHSHADKNTKAGTCPVIITTNTLIDYNTTCFDNVIVDYDNRTIRMIRQGPGSSRAFSLDTGELI